MSYELGHPLRLAGVSVDSEHALDPMLGTSYVGESVEDPALLAARMRAKMLGAGSFTGATVAAGAELASGYRVTGLHPLTSAGPALAHEVRQAVNHGYPPVVEGQFGDELEETDGERARSRAAVLAYKGDGTFLVLGKHALSWVDGAWLTRPGLKIYLVSVSADEKEEGK